MTEPHLENHKTKEEDGESRHAQSQTVETDIKQIKHGSSLRFPLARLSRPGTLAY